jgi:hypothetical protein
METPTLPHLENPFTKQFEGLIEGLPNRMDPGMIFVFENGEGKLPIGDPENPYVGVFSCLRCGAFGLITRRHLLAREPMICCGRLCSAECYLDGENIVFRKPQ